MTQNQAYPKHIVLFSGGKDSTCMLLMMIENNISIDDIVFCDTGQEFPEVYRHIKDVQIYSGRKITVLKGEKGWHYWFAEHTKTKGKRKGQKGYGWPDWQCRWCVRVLKNQPLTKYIHNLSAPAHTYYAIIYDERHRSHDNAYPGAPVFPLVDWKITQKQALRYCYEQGFDWNGLYRLFSRTGCFCCPLKRISELETLYYFFPHLWRKIKNMDRLTHTTFKTRSTVSEIEHRIRTS